MIIVKATPDSEAGVMPQDELIATMATYHEDLVKAGVLLDASGLQPSSKGWRVKYACTKRIVIDGPFTETKLNVETLRKAYDAKWPSRMSEY